jgi:hypothetical protein
MDFDALLGMLETDSSGEVPVEFIPQRGPEGV